MNKKSIAGITVAVILLVMISVSAYAAVAHSHNSGTPDCQTHSMKRVCWGSTIHIDTSTKQDAWGYTRARFESFGIQGDTLRNIGLGNSYANTNYDQDISGGHYCQDIDGSGARTYYGTASASASSRFIAGDKYSEDTDTVTYKVNVDTGETTIVEGAEE